MTKDVLVSISGKHIDIMDDPARDMKSEKMGSKL